MYCAVKTATILGVEAIPVEVQVHIASGLPSFQVVGLPDVMVQESRDRVRSALRSTGFSLPASRITVNLAPAALRKHGSGFDLPIALGILAASQQLPRSVAEGILAVGELGLDGAVVPVAGDLAFAILAARGGLRLLAADASRAAALTGAQYADIRSIGSLGRKHEACDSVPCGHLSVTPPPVHVGASVELDLGDVIGQQHAVRALTIAAVGRHNVLLIGPPGTGKTMLARRFSALLPPMSAEEALQTMLIHSVAGGQGGGEYGRRPFRDPHHSTTTVGLVGGGNPPHPGEVSLAHNGVLFLDELPQFGPAALQSLRTPLEDREVTIVRSEAKVTYPASFLLVAAANPCPCGYHGDPVVPCRCAPAKVAQYVNRIGGPLLDRFDLVVRVERPDPGKVLSGRSSDQSRSISEVVVAAAERAAPAVSPDAKASLEKAARNIPLSPRSIVRTLRVAGSIARLNGSDRVLSRDVFEALSYRCTVGIT